jgi:hypothetical protein
MTDPKQDDALQRKAHPETDVHDKGWRLDGDNESRAVKVPANEETEGALNALEAPPPPPAMEKGKTGPT